MPTYYLIMVAIGFTKAQQIEPSKTNYCEIEPNRHFLCEDETKAVQHCKKDVDIYSYPKSKMDQKDTLKALNDIRAGVANGTLQIGHPKFTPPQAANMYELKWDEECEKAARNIVKYCSMGSQFYKRFSNIFARFEAGLCLNLDFFSLQDNITTIADHFRHKINGDDDLFHDIGLISGKVTGRHTKPFYATRLSLLVKAEVSVVGCAMVIQNLGSHIVSDLACVFGGIYTWDIHAPLNLYENGPPCSRCPAESECSKDGLCDCKKRCFSYSKDVKNSGFYNSYAIVVDKEINEDKIIPLKEVVNGSYDSTYRYFSTSTTSTTTSTTTTSTTTTSTATTSMTMTTKKSTELQKRADLLAKAPACNVTPVVENIEDSKPQISESSPFCPSYQEIIIIILVAKIV